LTEVTSFDGVRPKAYRSSSIVLRMIDLWAEAIQLIASRTARLGKTSDQHKIIVLAAGHTIVEA
jgi:hypothetical protein